MVRSPKTGRELRGERGHRAPPLLRSFYRTVFGFFGTEYPEEDSGYAEELCFHHENGVATYWEQYETDEGLELAMEAIEALEEQEEYQNSGSIIADDQLTWAERIEEQAYDLIRTHFVDTYGAVPDEHDQYSLTDTESRALERHSDFQHEFFTERV